MKLKSCSQCSRPSESPGTEAAPRPALHSSGGIRQAQALNVSERTAAALATLTAEATNAQLADFNYFFFMGTVVPVNHRLFCRLFSGESISGREDCTSSWPSGRSQGQSGGRRIAQNKLLLSSGSPTHRRVDRWGGGPGLAPGLCTSWSMLSSKVMRPASIYSSRPLVVNWKHHPVASEGIARRN